MESSGYLDNTLIVLIADHGLHVSFLDNIFKLDIDQLKTEKVNPILIMAFPHTFAQLHPKQFENAKNNSKTLITMNNVHFSLGYYIEGLTYQY